MTLFWPIFDPFFAYFALLHKKTCLKAIILHLRFYNIPILTCHFNYHYYFNHFWSKLSKMTLFVTSTHFLSPLSVLVNPYFTLFLLPLYGKSSKQSSKSDPDFGPFFRVFCHFWKLPKSRLKMIKNLSFHIVHH